MSIVSVLIGGFFDCIWSFYGEDQFAFAVVTIFPLYLTCLFIISILVVKWTIFMARVLLYYERHNRAERKGRRKRQITCLKQVRPV